MALLAGVVRFDVKEPLSMVTNPAKPALMHHHTSCCAGDPIVAADGNSACVLTNYT